MQNIATGATAFEVVFSVRPLAVTLRCRFREATDAVKRRDIGDARPSGSRSTHQAASLVSLQLDFGGIGD